MPHKHTRKGQVDKSTIDLPPNTLAQPLSVSKSSSSNGIFTSELSNTRRGTAGARAANKKRKRKETDDDTPKAFQRLMAFAQGKKLPKGLDDGVRLTKTEERKRRKVASAAAAAASKTGAGDGEGDGEGEVEIIVEKGKDKGNEGNSIPTIRPGERMSDFSARVDAALPVAGLINKSVRSGKDPLRLKVGRTKTEKRMHRMYDEWRAEEARIQERRQETMEIAEEEEEEDEDGQVRWKETHATGTGTAGGGNGGGKKKKKGKGKKKVLGEIDDGEDDPWANVGKSRGEIKAGLNDVVLAPPTFTKPPREKFKVRGARVEVEDVPRKSGSLRRREELGGVRREVVQGYRDMMAKRGKDVVEVDEE